MQQLMSKMHPMNDNQKKQDDWVSYLALSLTGLK